MPLRNSRHNLWAGLGRCYNLAELDRGVADMRGGLSVFVGGRIAGWNRYDWYSNYVWAGTVHISISKFLALKTIMFNIIGLSQSEPSEEMVRDEEEQDSRTKKGCEEND